LEYNKKHNKCIIDGKVWYFGLNSKLQELTKSPESTVRRRLSKLNNILVKGNFNKNKYDKTIWYSVDEDAYFAITGEHFFEEKTVKATAGNEKEERKKLRMTQTKSNVPTAKSCEPIHRDSILDPINKDSNSKREEELFSDEKTSPQERSFSEDKESTNTFRNTRPKETNHLGLCSHDSGSLGFSLNPPTPQFRSTPLPPSATLDDSFDMEPFIFEASAWDDVEGGIWRPRTKREKRNTEIIDYLKTGKSSEYVFKLLGSKEHFDYDNWSDAYIDKKFAYDNIKILRIKKYEELRNNQRKYKKSIDKDFEMWYNDKVVVKDVISYYKKAYYYALGIYTEKLSDVEYKELISFVTRFNNLSELLDNIDYYILGNCLKNTDNGILGIYKS
jgi:hypothetical protein